MASDAGSPPQVLSKEDDKDNEDDLPTETVEEVVVVTPGPPIKKSKMTESSSSSKSRPPRFGVNRNADQAEEKVVASSQYTFPNKATFSGTVSSGSSSSSHFKHKYVLKEPRV
jgi:hypothetical protein